MHTRLDPKLAGICHNGYDDSGINSICTELTTCLPDGEQIICVWEEPDDGFGMHGGSELFLAHPNGTIHATSDRLWTWLAELPGTPDAPADPGSSDTWAGAPSEHTWGTLTPGNGDHNYSINS